MVININDFYLNNYMGRLFHGRGQFNKNNQITNQWLSTLVTKIQNTVDFILTSF
jgi:hypothetical protein